MVASTKPTKLLSPLRYPGSKRRLVPYIKSALDVNALKPALYIEPFVGGASIALQLMSDAAVEKVLLMDVDPWITSFWTTVFFDTDWLVDQIETMDVSLERWQHFKASNPQTVRDQAITCFFLNRTSFSGILEGRAGPLGGRKQVSAYKIDCRFMRKTLVARIRQAAAQRQKVIGIWNCSWDAGFARLRQEQQNGSLPVDDLFFYLDPPFFEEAEALYRYYFTPKDHEALRDYLVALSDKWLLSYDSVAEVEKLYGSALQKKTNGTQRHIIEIIYSLPIASTRSKAQEVLLSNLDKLPENEQVGLWADPPQS